MKTEKVGEHVPTGGDAARGETQPVKPSPEEPALPGCDTPKFWADDFDMDLLKVFPNVKGMLRDPDIPLWTVGHESYGRLNHPCCWNDYGAFLWLQKPNLARDKHGWFSIGGHVSNEPEIECTWLEWLRDAWSHHYATMILPSQQRLPASPDNDFMAIMYDLRGWHKTADLAEHRKRALHWIMRCDFILQTLRSAAGQQSASD